MKKKFINFLILATLIGFLPLNSLISPTKAQAAKISPKNSIVRFSSTDQSNTYHDGQRIKIDLNLAKVGLKVTADLSVIDETLSSEYIVTDNKTGTYTLLSPVLLGETMKFGRNIAVPFKIYENTTSFLTVKSSYLVNLQERDIIGGANLKAPVRLSAKAEDGKVTLWWSKIYNSKNIVIRYQDDQGQNRSLVVPAKNTGKSIVNLKNGRIYSFSIAGQTSSGTIGEAKTINVKMPPVKVETKITEKTQNEVTAKRIDLVAATTVKKIDAPKKEVISANKLLDEQKDKVVLEPEKKDDSSETQNSTTQGANRILLSIGILIIAAGAAIGGYYGYEWLTESRGNNKVKAKSKDRW